MDIEKVLKVANAIFELAMPVVMVLIPVVVGIFVKQLKDKQKQKQLADAADVAYLVVHQMSRKTENKIDDKIAEAIKVVADTLGRDLTEKEKKQVEVKLKAKHEVNKFPNLLNIKEVGGFVGNILGFGNKEEK